MGTYAPFCIKQANYIKQCLVKQNWLNIAEGGKRAGKNLANIIAWCEILETHLDKLHLAAGVSVATAKLNIIDSNNFGLLAHFKGRCRLGKYLDRDALYIYTRTGEKIVLISGGGKSGDERYIKGLSLGTAYVTEVNECAQSFVQEVFDRTTSSSQRKLIFDLNPKPELNWFYTDILDKQQENSLKYKDYGFNYEHFTIHDNLSLSNEQIKEIIRTYDKKSIWYQRDILGLRKNAEGIIFDSFNVDNQYTNAKGGPDWELYYKRFYSLDYGTINPFAAYEIIEQTISGNTEYYIENEYYYDSKKMKKQKSDREYADSLYEFIGNKKYLATIIDPSAASFKLELMKNSLRPRSAADTINADNEVLNGIRLVYMMFQANKLHVNIDNCPYLVKELGSYVWDEKASERGIEKPVKENDHGCDGIRYFAKTIVRSFKI